MRLYENQPIGTVPRARQLRRDASEPERRLLKALRSAFSHLKWRHQTPVGPFYADILCFSARLVIEVDGDTHADAQSRDAERTGIIQKEGFHVIRYTNIEVIQNTDGVITNVASILKEKGSAV